MYATRPLTPSQINDLKAWSSHANAEDRLAAEAARPGGKSAEEHRARERDAIRLRRAERDARDQERWQREKRRRALEKEIAWEERRRDEWRRYYRERPLEEEGERLMMIDSEVNGVGTTSRDVEDEEEERQWRREIVRRHLGSTSRWNRSLVRSGASVIKPRRIYTRSNMARHSQRWRIQDELVQLEFEVVTRIAPKLYRLNDWYQGRPLYTVGEPSSCSRVMVG